MKALGADSGTPTAEGYRIRADLDAEVTAFADRDLTEQAFS